MRGLCRAALSAGLAISCAAATLASCAAPSDEAYEPPRLEPQRVPEQDRSTAVALVADGCRGRASRGSGAVVDIDRVVTVAHVVAGTDSIEVTFTDGRTEPAVVVAMDRQRDLAVLRVATGGIEPLALRETTAVADGEVVLWRDDVPIAAAASLLRYVDITADDIDREERPQRFGFELQVAGGIEPGDSGAVVIIDGAAAAIVFARSRRTEDRAWATAPSELAPLLEVATDAPVDVGDCA